MEIFISSLMGVVVSGIIEFGKRSGYKTSDLFIGLSLLFGLIWGSIELFAPVGLSDNILDFSAKIMGTAAIVYSFFGRFIKS